MVAQGKIPRPYGVNGATTAVEDLSLIIKLTLIFEKSGRKDSKPDDQFALPFRSRPYAYARSLLRHRPAMKEMEAPPEISYQY